MSTPYVGEIRMVGFSFQVNGWNYCNGATIAIADNDVLFALIGTTYGGDGQQTFKLPDLQGRVAVHQGSGFVIGQAAGTETVTLTGTQLPNHTHSNLGSTADGNTGFPQGNLLAKSTTLFYTDQGNIDSNLNNATLGTSGGNQPHENMQPYLCINFIIALFGIFPTQN